MVNFGYEAELAKKTERKKGIKNIVSKSTCLFFVPLLICYTCYCFIYLMQQYSVQMHVTVGQCYNIPVQASQPLDEKLELTRHITRTLMAILSSSDLLTFTFFSSSAMTLLVVWSASSKVNLQTDGIELL